MKRLVLAIALSSVLASFALAGNGPTRTASDQTACHVYLTLSA